MKTLYGDLLLLAQQGTFEVIVHGCNCFCTMGAGIALQIKNTFPQAFSADCATKKGDRSKLGTFSFAVIKREFGELIVVNAYTQFDWRGSGELVDYEALRLAMRAIKKEFGGKRIGYPRIGAGLARGDWSKIAKSIDEELVGEDHTVVERESPLL